MDLKSNLCSLALLKKWVEIKELGVSKTDGGFDMKIKGKVVLEDVNLGDSIAVNGTCLTVTHFDKKLSEFTVGLAPETLRLTSLIELEAGSIVNLERAVKPSTRMGGHFVQGHVDGTGEIVGTGVDGDSLWIKALFVINMDACPPSPLLPGSSPESLLKKASERTASLKLQKQELDHPQP